MMERSLKDYENLEKKNQILFAIKSIISITLILS